MVHLPLASLEKPPQKGLVLCLGMGTSFRSMMSWHIPVTVVELVPSVAKLLPLFHPDGEKLLTAPEGHIVVDDARRFLERSQEIFSVIVIDPPPPVEAAASSLLYSRELYAAASKRLAPDGILQQWIPWEADNYDEALLLVAMTKALSESFPHVRVFKSVEGWGLHFLASNRPIPLRTTRQMAALLPEKAAVDLVEWGPYETPQAQFAAVLSQEVLVSDIIALSPGVRAISDDRPTNEYYLVRRLFR
jgi:spermidine synthase